MEDIIAERARELGRHLSQTAEYQAMGRAREASDNDREMVTWLNRIVELEGELASAMQRGEEPEQEVREEYEKLYSEVQASPTYQSLVAAQTNFDKVLRRVNEEIARGMEAGAQSRIILPS